MPPLDGMILVIGPRLKSHLPIFTAIQTYPSCRFHLAADYADIWFAPLVVLNAPSKIDDNREVAHSFLGALTFNTEKGSPDHELAQIYEIFRNVPLVDAVERLLVPYRFTAPSDTQEIIGVLLQLSHALEQNPDAALMERVFNLPQRQGETDIHHHCKADNLG